MKEIKLSQNKVALVDDEDYEWLNQWKWQASYNKKCKTWSVSRTERKTPGSSYIFMSRQIMGFPENMDVDHINHNRFDHQRVNLRICTHSDNMKNRRSFVGSLSRYKGVAWHKGNKMWQANITIDGKQKSLGYSSDEVEMAKKYDNAAKQYHGEFAVLNFPE